MQELVERNFDGKRAPIPRPGGQKGGTRTVTVNLRESPLTWLRARGLATARQYEAGDRLRATFERAQLAPSVTMRWDAAPGGTRRRDVLDPSEAQLAARQHFHAALDAVGPGLRDVLWRVVCAGEGLSAAERALGWPSRAGKLVLTFALDRLADYWGLP